MYDTSGLLQAIDRYLAKAEDDLAEQLRLEGYADPKNTVKTITELEEEVAEVLVKETAYFVNAAEAASKDDPRGALNLKEFFGKAWTKAKDKNKTADALYSIFSKKLRRFMPQYVQYYIHATDSSLKLMQVSKRTTAWVESWSRQLGSIMQLTSHNQLEDILKTGIEEGNGIDWFIRKIQEDGIRNEYYRARRVAVTEVLRAHSVAADEARMQNPCVTEKRWKHTGDHKNTPRDNHVDINGQTVPKNEPFTLIGADGVEYHPMFPRDPDLPAGESVNCHCLAQDIVSEDVLGLPLEERERLQREAIAEMDEKWDRELDEQNRRKAGIEIEKKFSHEGLTKPPRGAIIKYEGQDRTPDGRFTFGKKKVFSFKEYSNNPKFLALSTPEEKYKFYQKIGLKPVPLSNGRLKDVDFSDGGGFKVFFDDDKETLLMYHPENRSHHGGAYYKLSSGKYGTKRFDMKGEPKP